MTVVITKADNPSAGAIELEVTATGADFFIDHVSFQDSESIALEESAQGDYVRHDAYGGPVFEQLESELQEKFDDYLAERGFDEALAEFIPALIEAKEQDEYVRWLKNVGNFVSK